MNAGLIVKLLALRQTHRLQSLVRPPRRRFNPIRFIRRKQSADLILCSGAADIRYSFGIIGGISIVKVIEPQADECSLEVQETHLIAFARAFILGDRAERWLHMTVENPKKARVALAKLPESLNPQFCKRISGADAWPESLTDRLGSDRGVYFNGKGAARRTIIAQAAAIRNDAVFSLVPGKLAVCFFHEGWTWICECGQ
ncbi:hypothetical protein EJN92_11350 [Undibacterium parvum]|uniref:Uncharacterized protein n=1 Tax=Undibacterium parvum TaxID=401471 RepID=A0A3S9HKD2_9BURK|nr:hypothetical protein EJN92_11350 [Undibacterium parvum]